MNVESSRVLLWITPFGRFIDVPLVTFGGHLFKVTLTNANVTKVTISSSPGCIRVRSTVNEHEDESNES